MFVHTYLVNLKCIIQPEGNWGRKNIFTTSSFSEEFCKFGSLANIQQGYSWISEGMLSEYSEELPCYMGMTRVAIKKNWYMQHILLLISHNIYSPIS